MSDDVLQQQARDHLWMHFTRHSGFASPDPKNAVPIRSSGVSAVASQSP